MVEVAYCFRIRFELPDIVRIDSGESRFVLTDSEADETVDLRTAVGAEGGENLEAHAKNPVPFRDAGRLVLRGEAYETEEEANAAAQRWRALTEKAFAGLNLPADFGDRAHMSSHTEHGLRWREEQLGRRVLNDVHGVLVFECEPPPAFVTMDFTPLKMVQEDRVRAAVLAAAERNTLMSGEDSVAYTLYTASALVAPGSADARFALLMMAVEALITPKPRAEAVRAHVDHLIAETQEADLPDHEIKSILSTLDWLHMQSIGQAGRELAAKLGAREYLGKTPSRFFTDCYKLRSRLLHGQHPVPTMQEVNQYAGSLELFVADLLSLDPSR